MRFFLKFLLFLLGLVLFFIVIFWGFIAYFPGASLAQRLQYEVQKQTQIQLEFAPLKLEWTQFLFPEIALLPSPSWGDFPRVKLLVLENLSLSFWDLIAQQKASFRGKFHEGSLEFQSGIIPQSATLKATLNQVLLQYIPLLAVFPYGSASGEISLDLSVKNLNDFYLQKSNIPQGEFSGNIKNLNLKLDKLEELLMGMKLPMLQQEIINFKLKLAETITIEDLSFSGDLTGNIEGFLELNQTQVQQSRLDLKIKVLITDELLEELGIVANFLKGYQCDNTFQTRIEGTLEFPQFRQECF